MKEKNTDNNRRKKIISALGGILALTFYIISCFVVAHNNSVAGSKNKKSPESAAKTITIAHWQLEDGFREGIDYAIKEFEKLKAEQGERVKVIQNAIPSRGYSQWYITQLISGNPADVIELTPSPEIQSRYFMPLSEHIVKPNPFNKGTPCEKIAWKDTFTDGMDGALNPIFAEYFGAGIFRHCQRVYVNLDLLKAATGSEKTPETLEEWIECCKKIEEYGQKINKPLIPIGVRGIGKTTVGMFFSRYFAQTNNHYNDTLSLFGDARIPNLEMFSAFGEGKLDIDRMLAPVEMMHEIGKYFSEGFTTTDSQQTKFLFFTGNVCFFPEGTWDAWSMVNNTPFKVKIIRMPSISPTGKYKNIYSDRIYENAFGVSGKFGITKASRHPELALEFLQFLTSWKINQKTMMEFCKWPAVVINTEYTGFLEAMKPEIGDSKSSLQCPFFFNEKSRMKALESIERIITEQPENAKVTFAKDVVKNVPILKDEFENVSSDYERQLFDMEGNRTTIACNILRSDLSDAARKNQNIRALIAIENTIARELERRRTIAAYNSMDKIKEQLEDYISNNEESVE